MNSAIHWFRRDLRTADNTAFSQAVRQAEVVHPLFILDDAILSAPDMGAARVSFLLDSLRILAAKLSEKGYRLTVRRGDPLIELVRFCHETHAEAVFCNRDYEPYCLLRDARAFNELNRIGVGFECMKDSVVWEEKEILTQTGKPYTVFTPYSKAWRAKPISPPVPEIPSARVSTDRTFPSQPIPAASAELGYPLLQLPVPAGESAATIALESFAARHLLAYGDQRDFPALDATSRLSPHLHFGTINVRTLLAQWRESCRRASPAQARHADVFVNELIWREFYLQILVNFPYVAEGSFRKEFDALPWSQNQDHFQAWGAGMTGYPMVDAAMRALNATGWMHNRNRMIVSMFLTKDLLLPWTWGERYFMQKLVDGDLSANNGGWQWSAGTGTDAAPYFRVFNPVSQGERFDPDGQFVRRWIPELAMLPGAVIHRPWEHPAASSRGYPPRIVVHEEQRPKCLALYQQIRNR